MNKNKNIYFLLLSARCNTSHVKSYAVSPTQFIHYFYRHLFAFICFIFSFTSNKNYFLKYIIRQKFLILLSHLFSCILLFYYFFVYFINNTFYFIEYSYLSLFFPLFSFFFLCINKTLSYNYIITSLLYYIFFHPIFFLFYILISII